MLDFTAQERDIEIRTDVFGSGLTNGQLLWRPYEEPDREAVDVHWLYTGEDTGPQGAEAYIAHFRPGSHTDQHRHMGFEVMFILDGELHNDNGDRYLPGTLVIERPGSVHRVSSPHGSKVLVIREKRAVPLPHGHGTASLNLAGNGQPTRPV